MLSVVISFIYVVSLYLRATWWEVLFTRLLSKELLLFAPEDYNDKKTSDWYISSFRLFVSMIFKINIVIDERDKLIIIQGICRTDE